MTDQEAFPEGGGSKAAEPLMGLAEAPKDAEQKALAASQKSMSLMASAEAFAITTREEFVDSGELLRDIKAQQQAVTKTRTDITRPMDAAKKKVMDLFKPVSERLIAAEQTIKAAMLTFTRAEEARARAEEAEAERVAEEERKRMLKRAEAQREAGHDIKAGTLERSAQEIVAPAPPPPTKAPGIYETVTWSAEVTDKMALIQAVAANPDLEAYLDANMTALHATARAVKNAMAIPGVKAVKSTGVSARAG